LELAGNWPASGAGAFRAAGVRTYRREARWIEAREELEPSARVVCRPAAREQLGASAALVRKRAGQWRGRHLGGARVDRPWGKEIGAVGWWVRIRRDFFPLIATQIAVLYGHPVVDS
jgi:hypothetical protein